MPKFSILPTICSKKEAEIFLLFLLKYHEHYLTGFPIRGKFVLISSFDVKYSVKPFFFRVKGITSADYDVMVYTFSEAIEWIFKNRVEINSVIRSNNQSGWYYFKGSTQYQLRISLGDLISEDIGRS